MLSDLVVKEFLDETAAGSPAPGGGSVAALAAGLGAALTSMVCRLTIGKKKYAGVQNEMESMLKKSERLRAEFTVLVDADTQAFNNVMAAFGMSKDTDEEISRRAELIQLAVKEATLIPLRVMELCTEAISVAAAIVEKGNAHSLSDAGVAVLMIRAACEGAALNVNINLDSLQEKEFIADTKKQCGSYQAEVSAAADALLAGIKVKLS